MQINYFKKPKRKIPDSIVVTDSLNNIIEVPVKRVQARGRERKVNPFLLGLRCVKGYSFTKDKAELIGIAQHDGTTFELYSNQRNQQAIFFDNGTEIGSVRLVRQSGTAFEFK